MLIGELAIGVPGWAFSHWIAFIDGEQPVGGPTVPADADRGCQTPLTAVSKAVTMAAATNHANDRRTRPGDPNADFMPILLV
jgi:hypothetical protein